MRSLPARIGFLLLGLALFLTVSWVARSQVENVTLWLQGAPAGLGMLCYVLLGIVTTIIPFGSILPFIPLAVALWGWPVTAVLTATAWTTGYQIVFEIARRFGAPWLRRAFPDADFGRITRVIGIRKNILREMLLRSLLHGDLVSYAYGVLTDVGRFRFGLVTAGGVLPVAVMYALFGDLPLWAQASMGILGVLLLSGIWIAREYRARTPHLRLHAA